MSDFERTVQEATISVLANVASNLGDADAKILAVDYANQFDAVYATTHGQTVLERIIDETTLPTDEVNSRPDKNTVWTGRGESWMAEDAMRATEVAAVALGNTAGITLVRPTTEDEYLAAGESIWKTITANRGYDPELVSMHKVSKNAQRAEQKKRGHVIEEWSIPGTAYLHDAVKRLRWNRNVMGLALNA